MVFLGSRINGVLNHSRQTCQPHCIPRLSQITWMGILHLLLLLKQAVEPCTMAISRVSGLVQSLGIMDDNNVRGTILDTHDRRAKHDAQAVSHIESKFHAHRFYTLVLLARVHDCRGSCGPSEAERNRKRPRIRASPCHSQFSELPFFSLPPNNDSKRFSCSPTNHTVKDLPS